MEKLYKDIKRIDSKHHRGIARKLGKITEELGELFSGVYSFLGWKRNKKNKTESELKENILEEGADVIQNVFCVLSHFGFTYEQVIEELDRKNKVFEKCFDELEK